MENFPFGDETYMVIGICMDVHRMFGDGFLEIVYKDAIEFETRKRKIFYDRGKEYDIYHYHIREPFYPIGSMQTSSCLKRLYLKSGPLRSASQTYSFPK